MPRKPAPAYAPIDPTPADLTPEELWKDGALSIPAAAEFLGGIGTSTLRKLLRRGAIPSKKVAGRRVVPTRGLILYLATC